MCSSRSRAARNLLLDWASGCLRCIPGNWNRVPETGCFKPSRSSRKTQIINFYEVYWINFLNLLSSDRFNSLNSIIIMKSVWFFSKSPEMVVAWKLSSGKFSMKVTIPVGKRTGRCSCDELHRSTSGILAECSRSISQTTCNALITGEENGSLQV